MKPIFVYTHMLAFMDGHKVRPIIIPEFETDISTETLLELAFKYGQNDFSPSKEFTSVSAGDVLDVGGSKLFMVCRFGFKEISMDEFDEYKKLPRRDRLFASILDS